LKKKKGRIVEVERHRSRQTEKQRSRKKRNRKRREAGKHRPRNPNNIQNPRKKHPNPKINSPSFFSHDIPGDLRPWDDPPVRDATTMCHERVGQLTGEGDATRLAQRKP
jgi:hypothetical protein